MSEILLSQIVFDQSIYPRAEWSQTTVDRYVEALAAGDMFPAIVLERGTNRLLDGMHRLQAHAQADAEKIYAEYVDIPADVPAKLFAASLSTKHGDAIAREDLAAIAQEIARANPDYSLDAIARYSNVTRQTVSKWVGHILERRKAIRNVKVLLLTRLGWSQERIAEEVGASQPTVSRIQKVTLDEMNTGEDLIAEALQTLPSEAADAAEGFRQERVFALWTPEERELLTALRAGHTIVVTLRGAHDRLIRWAESAGLYQRIDRKSEWGNPFELPADGDRPTVIQNYAAHFLPFKPSLLAKLDSLRGKALGCWCAPEACHGHALRAVVAAKDSPSIVDTLPILVELAERLSPEDFVTRIIGGPGAADR